MINEKEMRVESGEINKLAKNYNTLDYSINLAKSLKVIFPAENFDHFSKYDLHQLFNDTLLHYYNGEEIIKYLLFKQYISKKGIIAAFEAKANNSRVDFLTINGCTTSFEIKSELDNLSKLSKQMNDYMLAFEYNYLITDERHYGKALELLPDCYGLWIYKNGKYKKLRKALINERIDPRVQLNILTKKELCDTFPETNGDIRVILSSYNKQQINEKFKIALKTRYRTRWQFLIDNYNDIFPIDVQFFFNTNIEPRHIYNQ